MQEHEIKLGGCVDIEFYETHIFQLHTRTHVCLHTNAIYASVAKKVKKREKPVKVNNNVATVSHTHTLSLWLSHSLMHIFFVHILYIFVTLLSVSTTVIVHNDITIYLLYICMYNYIHSSRWQPPTVRRFTAYKTHTRT